MEIIADVRGLAGEWVGPLTVILLGVAILFLACRRLLPLGSASVGFVFFLSAAGAIASVPFRTLTTTKTQHVAWLCAFLCLFWSLVIAAATASRRRAAETMAEATPEFVSLCRLAAVLFGVVTGIIQSVVLVMRLIYVGVDIVHGYPWQGVRNYGFGPLGLWSLVLLFLSCGIGLLFTGARRLATVLLWTAVLLTLWACLLFPPFEMHDSGAFERTAGTMLLLGAMSMLLLTAVVVETWFRQRNRNAHRSENDFVTAPNWDAPGFTASCGVLALIIILLTCYHFLVPVSAIWGGFRSSTICAAASAAVAAWGSLLLLKQSWSDNLADAALGLVSLSLCGLAMVAVPDLPATLGERYPMMFNAMIVGLTLATGWWTWFACVRPEQVESGDPRTTARLIPHAKRFAFLNAALALVAGALMTYWPRLRSIAGMDHSLGRITAGFAAHLFLVLVMLWCSRRLRSVTFHLLTVLAVILTAAFIVVRMVRFISWSG